MSNEVDGTHGVSRRTVTKIGAMMVGAHSLSIPVRAGHIGAEDAGDEGESSALDSPEGFGVEILTPHANFPDDVGAKFRMKYEGGDGAIVSNLPRDASSVIFAKVTWEPEGTSGWHTHPGPVVVSVAEGELELVNERDCVVRTYTAGEAFVDPGQGNVHIATNPSRTDRAVAYATFLGVPDGKPATVWVAPVDCTGVCDNASA
jgi:quercetin dioxygenase-like cupin family protein